MDPQFRDRVVTLFYGEPALEPDRFWGLVERVGWRDPGAPHEDRLVAEGFRDTVLAHTREMELAHQLSEVLAAQRGSEALQRQTGHLHSMLTSHVIGLGRAVFEAAARDPRGLLARGRTRDFREGFDDLFPKAVRRFSDDVVRSAFLGSFVPRPWLDGERWRKDALVRHEQWGLGIVKSGALNGVAVAFESGGRVLPGSVTKEVGAEFRARVAALLDEDPATFETIDEEDLRDVVRRKTAPVPWQDGKKWRVGAVVEHPWYGYGVVEKKARGGLLVLFERGPRLLPGGIGR